MSRNFSTAEDLRKHLVIPDKIIADKQHLIMYLTEYYLIGNCQVSLAFPINKLAMVETAFDEIIRKHGVLTSNFEFCLLADKNIEPLRNP